MLVFRVENDRDNGPYINSPMTSLLLHPHNYSGYHTSAKDIMPKNIHIFKCGFESISLLKKWFHGYLGMLNDYDFKISVYDIEDYFVITDNKQVLFPVQLADKLHIIRTNNTKKYETYKHNYTLLNGLTCTEKERSDFLLEVMGELLIKQKQTIEELKNENSRINQIKNKLAKGRTTHGVIEVPY